MIRKDELNIYGRQLNFNMGQVEKDFLQHLVLKYLYEVTGIEFVFKGGTALQKCYGLQRFSEDLDFTYQGEKTNISETIEKVNQKVNLLYESTYHEPKQRRKIESSEKYIFKIKGPSFSGNVLTFVSLRLDISLREHVLVEPKFKTVSPIYPMISPYSVFLMSEEELLAEKIRAIISRNNARDVYDLWYLLRKNIKMNKDFAEQKLSIQKHVYSADLLISKIEEKRKVWDKELKTLILNFPYFQSVIDEIILFLQI